MSIDKNWLQAIDQIVTASLADKRRIVGITSPHENSGVTRLASTLAESFALSHVKSLLINLSGESQTVKQSRKNVDEWVPVLKDPAEFITTDKAGFDRLESHPNIENRFVFNNIEKFREVLDKDLISYQAIIIDLPAILSDNLEGINSASCAAACDAVFLVSMIGQTTRTALGETRERLSAAKAPLAGVILNDRDHISTGQSMVKTLEWLQLCALDQNALPNRSIKLISSIRVAPNLSKPLETR